MQIITYQAPSGRTIDLSRQQQKMLTARGVWPRDQGGEEYCSVSRGTHDGYPTMDDAALLAISR